MGLLGGFMGLGAGTGPTSWTYQSSYSKFTAANNFGSQALANLMPVPFAAGGIVTAPTLSMIGEGNDDEVVFPLNSNTYAGIGKGIASAMGAGGNAPVINIINNSNNSRVGVKQSNYDNNLRRWVLNVVVEDVNNNTDGAATNLRAALGVK